MPPHIVGDVEHELGGRSPEAQFFDTFGVVEEHPVLEIGDAFDAVQQFALLDVGVA